MTLDELDCLINRRKLPQLHFMHPQQLFYVTVKSILFFIGSSSTL